MYIYIHTVYMILFIIFTASVICTWSSWRCVCAAERGMRSNRIMFRKTTSCARFSRPEKSPLVRSLSAENSSEIHLWLSPTNYTCRTPPTHKEYKHREREGFLHKQYSREGETAGLQYRRAGQRPNHTVEQDTAGWQYSRAGQRLQNPCFFIQRDQQGRLMTWWK